MNNYQKAIKVREECEKHIECAIENNCPYYDKCFKSNILFFPPETYDIKTIIKAIEEEDWNIE